MLILQAARKYFCSFKLPRFRIDFSGMISVLAQNPGKLADLHVSVGSKLLITSSLSTLKSLKIYKANWKKLAANSFVFYFFTAFASIFLRGGAWFFFSFWNKSEDLWLSNCSFRKNTKYHETDMKITKNWQDFPIAGLKYETAKVTEQLSSSQVAHTVF